MLLPLWCFEGRGVGLLYTIDARARVADAAEHFSAQSVLTKPALSLRFHPSWTSGPLRCPRSRAGRLDLHPSPRQGQG